MRNLPVHWHEGMFLRPQHFQSSERHWTEVLQLSERWDHQYNYGLRSIDFSREAIGNQHFQLIACQARLRDGTLISLDWGREPDRVDLREALAKVSQRSDSDLSEAFEKQSSVTAYLAIPRLRLGQPNVSSTLADETRYQRTELAVQDESAGGNDQPIEHRVPNVRLLLSTDDHSGYEILPIARISRIDQEGAAPKLDESYIPPVLALDAWPPLAALVRDIYEFIGQNVTRLSEQAINRAINLSSFEAGDLQLVLTLRMANEAFATLHQICLTQGVHPFHAYTELCRIVGMLSVLDESRRVPHDMPVYDHDNLSTIFNWVRMRIRKLLYDREETDVDQRYFVGAGNILQVRLDPKWFTPNWEWFVGVDPGPMDPQECRELLNPGRLNWKMGSSESIDQIFQRGQAGVELSDLARAPRQLPVAGNWVFYKVDRSGYEWHNVERTKTLALRLNSKLIGNLAQLEGQRALKVEESGRPIGTLEFALFAVRTQ